MTGQLRKILRLAALLPQFSTFANPILRLSSRFSFDIGSLREANSIDGFSLVGSGSNTRAHLTPKRASSSSAQNKQGSAREAEPSKGRFTLGRKAIGEPKHRSVWICDYRFMMALTVLVLATACIVLALLK